MDTHLLKDETIFPSDDVIQSALGEAFPAFKEFIGTIGTKEFNLLHEWRYYKDGKAWLCKVTQKKKTVVWISVWPGFFKTAFYFTEKTGMGIEDLNISKSIKEQFKASKPTGKLKPLVIEVRNIYQLSDVFATIHYKTAIMN
jgi:hypothetical protein